MTVEFPGFSETRCQCVIVIMQQQIPTYANYDIILKLNFMNEMKKKNWKVSLETQ